jgi:hypothetical protein
MAEGAVADPERNRTAAASVVKILNNECLFAINERAAGVAGDIESQAVPAAERNFGAAFV